MGTGTPTTAADGTIPAALAGACADLAAASELDAVSDRQSRYVAAPASTTEAAALLRAAAELGLTVVPRGSGSRLHWGAPPASCDLIVDTRRLDQIVEHAAGDLVVTVQAGVRLDDLADVLASADQRLALDARSSAEQGGGTVGGLIATGAAGPLRYRYGSPRDLLIGITIVRADGAVAKSGGKVVKNVAGYDLGKLFAGSYGTLGLITEATFRLHPKPETSTWITVECSSPASVAEVVQAMANSPLAPSAIEACLAVRNGVHLGLSPARRRRSQRRPSCPADAWTSRFARDGRIAVGPHETVRRQLRPSHARGQYTAQNRLLGWSPGDSARGDSGGRSRERCGSLDQRVGGGRGARCANSSPNSGSGGRQVCRSGSCRSR